MTMRMQSRHYRPHPYQVLLVTSDGPEMMIMKVCNSVFHVFLHYMVQNYLLGIQSVKNMFSIILCNDSGQVVHTRAFVICSCGVFTFSSGY